MIVYYEIINRFIGELKDWFGELAWNSLDYEILHPFIHLYSFKWQNGRK